LQRGGVFQEGVKKDVCISKHTICNGFEKNVTTLYYLQKRYQWVYVGDDLSGLERDDLFLGETRRRESNIIKKLNGYNRGDAISGCEIRDIIDYGVTDGITV